MIVAFELMKYVHTPSPDENKSIEQGLDLFCKYYRDFTKKAFICDFFVQKVCKFAINSLYLHTNKQSLMT